MASVNDPREQVHLLLERISSIFRADLRQLAAQEGLKLVQLEALIYLSKANRYSDTAAGLSEYLGVTKGTVSQTLNVLERRGLLNKYADPLDGRISHCRPTDSGVLVVQKTYPSELLRQTPEARRFASDLRDLLRSLQTAGGNRAFGQCQNCRHFRRDKKGTHCGLTEEKLSRVDALLICREFAHA